MPPFRTLRQQHDPARLGHIPPLHAGGIYAVILRNPPASPPVQYFQQLPSQPMQNFQHFQSQQSFQPQQPFQPQGPYQQLQGQFPPPAPQQWPAQLPLPAPEQFAPNPNPTAAPYQYPAYVSYPPAGPSQPQQYQQYQQYQQPQQHQQQHLQQQEYQQAQQYQQPQQYQQFQQYTQLQPQYPQLQPQYPQPPLLQPQFFQPPQPPQAPQLQAPTYRFALFIVSDSPSQTGDLHSAILTHPHPRYPHYTVQSEHSLGSYSLTTRPENDVLALVSIGRAGRGRDRDLRRIRKMVYEALGGGEGTHRPDLDERWGLVEGREWRDRGWWRVAVGRMMVSGEVGCLCLEGLEKELEEVALEEEARVGMGQGQAQQCISVLQSRWCPDAPWTLGL